MVDSFMIITEKDWDDATEKQRSWMLFNTIQSMDTRLKKLEKRPIVDKICSFGGGVVGGALAYLGIKIGG
ncbi:MAG: hypothetical protein ACTSP3_12760 [Candidatus Heimdallarchaeaceae archaeon]